MVSVVYIRATLLADEQVHVFGNAVYTNCTTTGGMGTGYAMDKICSAGLLKNNVLNQQVPSTRGQVDLTKNYLPIQTRSPCTFTPVKEKTIRVVKPPTAP
jgi:hypothetical protein